ncbi:unnamed protein product [Spirodela intermedia]|uniref:Uncharacterized protein n=1 Tax=Spirodela intermedia TaxID=51605 RepID=A0ABN7E929_SPIIN|nr:unnamed protein product [Spirodela intermedia]
MTLCCDRDASVMYWNLEHLGDSRVVQVPSRTCMTTPCPTAGWPPVTWKESGTHVSLSIQAALAHTHSYSPTELLTRS